MKAVRLATLAVTLLGTANARAGDIPAVTVIEGAGVTCPSAGAVTAALARFSGQPGVGEPFRLVVDRNAGQLHVELRDAAGRSVLVREIPVTATDCQHAAEAIALIVERHFRALEWSPTEGSPVAAPSPSVFSARAAAATSPPPLPPPRSRPGNAPEPASSAPAPSGSSAPAAIVAETTRVTPVATPPTAAPEVSPSPVAATAVASSPGVERRSSFRLAGRALPRLAVGAGPAFWSRGETFAVALVGRWRILADGPLEIGAGVLLPPGQTSTAVGAGGSVHVAAVPVTASVGLGAALGRLATGVHAGALWTIERGRSESILAPATAWRTIVGAGLGISAAWPISERWRVTAAVDGYRTVLGRSYAISGVPGTVLDPSPWQAMVVLGAEWVLSP
jgi:hypothetical protein